MTASNLLYTWCIATPAFITLKDHKPDFRQNPSCRLINSAKNEPGKVSKLITDKINKKLISELHFNQWKNTDSVLKWFIDISNKKDNSFIQLDIKEFYPSINEDILTNAIQFAKLHTTIDEKDLRLIMHCKKSLLFWQWNQQKATLMLPLAVLTVLRHVNL